MSSHSVDIVIATHNRSTFLARVLSSIATLRCPPDWTMRLIVVGNACTDDSPAVVERFRATVTFPVLYVTEPTPGKAHALNAGVQAGTGEWIAFFDDDELVFDDWLEVFVREQSALGFDFVAGKYLPDFESPPPAWLPPRHTTSVIVRHPDALGREPLHADAALMWGGNCAISRAALQQVGLFEVAWGRGNGMRALGCEDTEMQLRLLRAGLRGWYLPELRILHWVPTNRVTRAHFRAKRFWAGYTTRQFELAHPEYFPVARRLFGVPGWRWRGGASCVVNYLRAHLRSNALERFDYELDCREFFGYLRAWVGEAVA